MKTMDKSTKVITGDWDGQPIYRDMTPFERYKANGGEGTEEVLKLGEVLLTNPKHD